MRKVLGTLVVLFIIGIAISAATHKNNNNGTSISLPDNGTSTSTSTAAPSSDAPEPGPFHGNGAENIGTITVPSNTVLHWSCASCGNDNFIVGNSFNDDNQIDVNALDQRGGQTVVDGGTYHDVQVNTEGNGWTLTFAHSS